MLIFKVTQNEWSIMDKKPIYVTQSSLPPIEDFIKTLSNIWDTHILTNMGEYHQRLEKELLKLLNISNISLMVNGHMALEMALQAMEFPQGSEIITTPFTFISTTHAIVRCGFKPVFCDIKLKDFTINENIIEPLITDKTVAILPVHTYGNICNYQEISKIASKYKLKVIYDAAHSFAETVNGIPVESLGDMSVLSFHATKVFNTIEGGAVCFQDEKIYSKLYNLKNFGIQSEEIVSTIGANGKMNEFCAAMGLCNLNYLKTEIISRKEKTLYYDEILSHKRNISIRERNSGIEYNYGYYPVLFSSKKHRDEIYIRLKENSIFARKYFYPITPDHQCFNGKFNNIDLPNARYASECILTLPLYPELSKKEIERICDLIC